MTATVAKTGATKRDILTLCREQGVAFLRLQFTDILGVNKNFEVPESQFDKALSGDIRFDGSAIEGFVRIEESDMVLKPDLETFRILPYDDEGGRVARLLCDIYNPDGSSFAGCPRQTLKRQITRAQALGYEVMVGVEAEFYIFQLDANGKPTTQTHDGGGYFDLTPVDKAEEIRRVIVRDLVSMGFEVEGGHHEVAPGQHEIDFRYAGALETADNLATFKFVVRNVAYRHGYLATFMPQPIFGQAGSGMHTSHSLFRDEKNAFHDRKAQWELSPVALQYIGGLLRHARGFCAVTNPLVNSYKRLVPGYEAPVHVAWSMRNRSPLIRIPERRDVGTRCEVRMPDPSADPYLSLAVQVAAGLDGVEQKLTPPDPVNKNIFEMSYRERRHFRIDDLPRDLHEALEYLEKDEVIRGALGEHIYERFVEAKQREWQEYIGRVSEWELERYLGLY
ncbi:MAG TPA: type I glutamate--ammonia ligase [Polyangiaceae bacterium]